MPASIFLGVWPGGQQVLLAAIGMLTFGVSLLVAGQTLRLRREHVWVGLLAGSLLISFWLPKLVMSTQTSRTADIVGLAAGLALLSAGIAAQPRPRNAATLIATVGAIASAFLLARGEYVDGRLEGLGLNPNYLGAAVALWLVAAAGLAKCRRNPVWLVPAGMCLVALLATQSRGAVLTAAAGLLFVFTAGRSPRQRLPVLLVLVPAVLLLPGSLDVVEQLTVGERSAIELTYNSDIRARTAEFAFQVALEHPLRGIGYGMFPPYAAGSPEIGIYINTHNDYLRLAAEAGVLAVLALLVLFWRGVTRWDTHSDTHCDTQWGDGDAAVLRAVAVAYAVSLLFGNTLSNLTVTAPFWVALGCLLSGRTKTVPTSEGPTGEGPTGEGPTSEGKPMR